MVLSQCREQIMPLKICFEILCNSQPMAVPVAIALTYLAYDCTVLYCTTCPTDSRTGRVAQKLGTGEC